MIFLGFLSVFCWYCWYWYRLVWQYGTSKFSALSSFSSFFSALFGVPHFQTQPYYTIIFTFRQKPYRPDTFPSKCKSPYRLYWRGGLSNRIFNIIFNIIQGHGGKPKTLNHHLNMTFQRNGWYTFTMKNVYIGLPDSP